MPTRPAILLTTVRRRRPRRASVSRCQASGPPRWDGEVWHLEVEAALPSLISPMMTWDARRRVAVLVGLASAADERVQTWECRLEG